VIVVLVLRELIKHVTKCTTACICMLQLLYYYYFYSTVIARLASQHFVGIINFMCGYCHDCLHVSGTACATALPVQRWCVIVEVMSFPDLVLASALAQAHD
jgi:hypothetical protein